MAQGVGLRGRAHRRGPGSSCISPTEQARVRAPGSGTGLALVGHEVIAVRPVAIVVTRPDGEVDRINPAAVDLLGAVTLGAPCSEVVQAGARGRVVCSGDCPASFSAGEQRDHGVVMVRGQPCHLLCSEVDGARVLTLTGADPEGSEGSGRPALSEREREVLVLVARGFTSERIASRLGVATSTICTHVERIREKLGVRTRSQAVARALATGQIE